MAEAIKCPAFSVRVKGEPGAVLEQVKKEGKRNLVIDGDAKRGTLKIKKLGLGVLVYGSYSVDDNKKITFNLVDATKLADCAKIEKGIKGYFKGK